MGYDKVLTIGFFSPRTEMLFNHQNNELNSYCRRKLIFFPEIHPAFGKPIREPHLI